MEQGEGKANTVHRQHPIALVAGTVHLDIVVAPLLDKLDCHGGLHKPCEHRIEQEYHLSYTEQRVVSCGGTIFKTLVVHTANPIRVAMDELQLHDLQNIEAIHGIQHGKRYESVFTRYLQWTCSRMRGQLLPTSRWFQIRPLGAKRGEVPFSTTMGLSAVCVCVCGGEGMG